MSADGHPGPEDVAGRAYALGVAALRSGRPGEAVAQLEAAACGAEGDFAVGVQQALAAAHRRCGDPARAARAYGLVAAARPLSGDAWLNFGAAQADAGDLAGAEQALERAAELDPADLQCRRALARVLNLQGRASRAQAVAEAGLALRPDDQLLLRDLARALVLQGRPEACADILRRALRDAPADPELRLELAGALEADGRTEEALRVLEELVALRPDDAAARLRLCIAHLPALYEDEDEVGRRRASYAQALRALSRWAADHPAAVARAVGVSQPFYLPHQGRNDRELQRIWGALIHRATTAVFPPAAPVLPPQPGEPIRVGIVSGYFRDHSNWRLPVEGWVRGLDRRRFRLIGHHTSGERDATTAQAAQLFDRFVQGPLSTERWREEISADAPHVLIYPEVGMDPAVLRLAAQRLAPLQAVSWGHPVTSGLPTLDVFLSSDAMEPPDGQCAYTERLLRLPGLSTRLHDTRAAPAPTSRDDLGLPYDRVVAWCGQSPFKYLPRHLDVLARIAAAEPGTVFVFAAFPGSDRLTELFAARVRAAFDRRPPAHGGQVRVLPRVEARAFAGAMAAADLVLDSLDWSGCNSLVESLKAGLPVVTTPGRFMRGRHGAALLGAMGLGHRVCPDEEAYVATAVRLIRGPELRERLAAEVRSALPRLFCDDAGVRALERFLIEAVAGGGGSG